MSKEKVTKWDLKAAAKLLKIDWNQDTEAKINELRGVAPGPAQESEAQAVIDDVEAMSNSASSQVSKELTALAVVQVNKEFLVVKVPFNLDDATIIKRVDNEARAVLERDRAEVEVKKLEYKQRR